MQLRSIYKSTFVVIPTHTVKNPNQLCISLILYIQVSRLNKYVLVMNLIPAGEKP